MSAIETFVAILQGDTSAKHPHLIAIAEDRDLDVWAKKGSPHLWHVTQVDGNVVAFADMGYGWIGALIDGTQAYIAPEFIIARDGKGNEIIVLDTAVYGLSKPIWR